MADIVYILCGVTSLLCAILLGRAYRSSRRPLLLWSALCFAGLFIDNIVTFIDLVILPATIDLHWVRSIVALSAEALLLVGLIWEAP